MSDGHIGLVPRLMAEMRVNLAEEGSRERS